VSSESNKAQGLSLTLLLSLAVGYLGPRLPEQYRPFFRLPRKTQSAELRTRPLEEQLDLYIAGVTGVRPARLDLGLAIGQQGPVIVPALLARIRSVPKEHVKADLVWIMVGMPCTAETTDCMSAALDTMRLEVASMRAPSSKASAEHSLRLAENRCRPSEFSARPGGRT
jgi:hypothetical protein